MFYSHCRTRPGRVCHTAPPRPSSERPGMTHLTYLEAAVVGLVQGVSEMFPVSSLGHSVLIPAIIGGFFTSIRDRRVRPGDQKLAWRIGLATVPVGVAGLLFEHAFRVIFGRR